jgi:hypothetical protein
MLTYAQLRDRLRQWPKYPGCHSPPRAPLITPAFPGAFNLSFTEHHWLPEYGAYLDRDHDYAFSTVQSCVRLGDFAALGEGTSRHHLGVFELSDLCGAIALCQRPDYRSLQSWQIEQLVGLLGTLGIGPERLHVSYSAGGRVAELTAGRYQFEQPIPPDSLSQEGFLAAGVPPAQLQPDSTRATFLALHVHRPTPWGYRNEVHLEVERTGRTELLEIATVEYFLWRPRFRNGQSSPKAIVGLDPLETGATLIACGLERLATAVNRLDRIHDVDYLQPFYRQLGPALGRELEASDYLIGESLRTLHRIYADLAFHPQAEHTRAGPDSLSRHRRKKLARLKRCIPSQLARPALERLLLAHSQTQPWHPHLEAAIEPTIAALLAYRGSRARGQIPGR